MRSNINNPLCGLFAHIFSFSEFFGNESYIEHNKTLNELYLFNKIEYGTKEDSILGTYFQKSFPA